MISLVGFTILQRVKSPCARFALTAFLIAQSWARLRCLMRLVHQISLLYVVVNSIILCKLRDYRMYDIQMVWTIWIPTESQPWINKPEVTLVALLSCSTPPWWWEQQLRLDLHQLVKRQLVFCKNTKTQSSSEYRTLKIRTFTLSGTFTVQILNGHLSSWPFEFWTHSGLVAYWCIFDQDFKQPFKLQTIVYVI